MLAVLKYCAENDYVDNTSFKSKSCSIRSSPERVTTTSTSEGVLARSSDGHAIRIVFDETPSDRSCHTSSSSSHSTLHLRENLALDADESDGWETVSSDECDDEETNPLKSSKPDDSTLYMGASETSLSEIIDSTNNSVSSSEWNASGLTSACELIFQLLDLVESERHSLIATYFAKDAKDSNERKIFLMNGPIILGAFCIIHSDSISLLTRTLSNCNTPTRGIFIYS